MVYVPDEVTVRFGDLGEATWNYVGTERPDSRYIKVGVLPHAGIRTTSVVHMSHCALKWAACTGAYFKMGIIGYYNGADQMWLVPDVQPS
jgi:hypothetical protein